MKFSIEIDSSDGSIKINSRKAPEENLIAQPTTTKSIVDENQSQNAGAFSGVPETEERPIGGISHSRTSTSDIESGSNSQQPPFHSDTFDFTKGSTTGKGFYVQPTTTKSMVDENQSQNAGAFSGVPETKIQPMGVLRRNIVTNTYS